MPNCLLKCAQNFYFLDQSSIYFHVILKFIQISFFLHFFFSILSLFITFLCLIWAIMSFHVNILFLQDKFFFLYFFCSSFVHFHFPFDDCWNKVMENLHHELIQSCFWSMLTTGNFNRECNEIEWKKKILLRFIGDICW